MAISIHALLAESDLADCTKIYAFGDFYPRSPCGERHKPTQTTPAAVQFLSTLSLRRATRIIDPTYGKDVFLSTLSLRRATPRLSRVVPTPIFLSTLSLRRATIANVGTIPDVAHFYPRSPCGERLP